MLGDVNELTKAIKKAAMDAVDASKPCNVFFGKVTSASPLKINVEQKMTLGEKQLVLTKTAKDAPLNENDEVVLLRQQGGQKFIVIDRLG